MSSGASSSLSQVGAVDLSGSKELSSGSRAGSAERLTRDSPRTQPTPRSRHQSLLSRAEFWAPEARVAAGAASLVQWSTVTVAPDGGRWVTGDAASGLAWAVGAPEMVAVRAA